MERPKETITIRTPEHVGFDYVLAGPGTRAVAFLVDLAVRYGLVLVIVVSVLLAGRWFPGEWGAGLLFGLPSQWIVALALLAYGVVELGYFLLFEALWSGQTPGKRVQGIRVIRTNGEPVGWVESSIRNILRVADMWAGVYPLGLLVMFFSPRNQRIGDYAAGTVVVLERGKALPGRRGSPGPLPGLERLDLESRVPSMAPEEYRLVRSFLDRRPSMDTPHRSQIARELALRLMNQWGIPARADLPYEPFLEAVAEAYERGRRAI